MAIEGQCFECGDELRPTVEVPHPHNRVVVPLCERCCMALSAIEQAGQLQKAHTHDWLSDAFDIRFSACSVCHQQRMTADTHNQPAWTGDEEEFPEDSGSSIAE